MKKSIKKRDYNFVLAKQGLISLKTAVKLPKKGKGAKYKRNKKVSY